MDSTVRRNSWAGGTPNGKLVKRLCRSKSIDPLHQRPDHAIITKEAGSCFQKIQQVRELNHNDQSYISLL